MPATGRVIQVSVSAGGVPKLPVPEARVGPYGLDGDGHNAPTVHGGPHRAVCLYSIEAIERLQAEGHPVEPGSVGENLTTVGVEWSLLPVGTRARIGADVLLELADSTSPCSTQRHNFRDGRFSRISIGLHPSDSRMYARVLAEGVVRPGDEIEVLPPAASSRAADELLLARLDRAVARSSLTGWRVARSIGEDVRIVDDGELVMAAAPRLPGPRWNQALGLARLPNLMTLATDFFDRQQTEGWMVTEPSLDGVAATDTVVAVFAADPAAIRAEVPAGLEIRELTPEDLPAWAEVGRGGGGSHRATEEFEAAFDAAVFDVPHAHRFIATLEGEPVGAASCHVTHHTGWLRGAMVVPAARGRGIQKALLAARVARAAELGCDLVGAWAEVGSVSATNMLEVGFRQVGLREHRRYVPAGVVAPR